MCGFFSGSKDKDKDKKKSGSSKDSASTDDPDFDKKFEAVLVCVLQYLYINFCKMLFILLRIN